MGRGRGVGVEEPSVQAACLSRDGDVTRGGLRRDSEGARGSGGRPRAAGGRKGSVARTSSHATVIPEGQAGAVQRRSVTTGPTRFPCPGGGRRSPRTGVRAPHHVFRPPLRAGLAWPRRAASVPEQHFVPPCDSHFRPRPALCPWHLPGRSEGRPAPPPPPALCSLQAPPTAPSMGALGAQWTLSHVCLASNSFTFLKLSR